MKSRLLAGLVVAAALTSAPALVAAEHGECSQLMTLKLPDVKDRLDATGFEPIGTTPDQFGSYIRTEVEKWSKVVKAAGVRAD